MNSPNATGRDLIDPNTCRSICMAVGERLQQSLRPEASHLSPHLQHLMDHLRKRDREAPPAPDQAA
jgi:hypothetical protein